MTKSLNNHRDRDLDLLPGDDLDDLDGIRRRRAVEFGELLERVRHNALRFIAEVPLAPRVLRVRAGEVSMEVEWAEERADAPPTPAPAVAAAESTASPEHYLTAPMVGVFYGAPAPDAAPFLRADDTVVVGQQVGLIEAMKLMVPVESDRTGRVVEVLKGDGESVEYGERLFALMPLDPS